jgi:1-acyl-sn-glycerol-3-phosphate acyltransferase
MEGASELTGAGEGAAPEKPKKRVQDFFLTGIFALLFFGLLLVWDVVQRVSFYGFGERALHRVDRTLNYLILTFLKVTGAKYKTVNPFVFSNTNSYIVVSNHQSMFDICLIHELFWHLTPRFISKQELGRWIPGISFNLRAGGHPLIDRSSGSKALAEILRLGQRLDRENSAAIIFPEGTRARDGVIKRFKPSGLLALLRKAPNAKVVIVAIDGSWRFQTFNLWPIPSDNEVRVEVVDVLSQSEFETPELVVEQCEAVIYKKLAGWRR